MALDEKSRFFGGQDSKAKYFPRKELLNATVTDRGSPSYSWKSILSSLLLLKEGVIHRIGNGEQIFIWDDAWLPAPPYWIRTEKPENCSLRYVVDLIDSAHKVWRMDILEQVFGKEDIDLILKISLSLRNPEDKWKWVHTSHGSYTTRTGYYIARNLEDGSGPTHGLTQKNGNFSGL